MDEFQERNTGKVAFNQYLIDKTREALTEMGSSQEFDSSKVEDIKNNLEKYTLEGGTYDLWITANLHPENLLHKFLLGTFEQQVIISNQGIDDKIKSLGEKLEIDLLGNGYNSDYLLNLIEHAKENNMWGEQSPIGLVGNKIVQDLPKFLGVKSRPMKKVAQALDSMGTSAKEIKDIHEETGTPRLEGVVDHLIERITQTPAGKKIIRWSLQKFEKRIKDRLGHDITLSQINFDRISEAITIYGFDGKNGAINTFFKEVLPQWENLGEHIYLSLVRKLILQSPTKVGNMYGLASKGAAKRIELGHLVDEVHKEKLRFPTRSEKLKESYLVQELFHNAKKTVPLCLQPDALRLGTNQGLMGEEGLFGYLAALTPEILAPFYDNQVINADQMYQIQESFQKYAVIETFNQFINTSLTVSTLQDQDYENIEIAADISGESVEEVLWNPIYQEAKNEIVNKYFDKLTVFDEALPLQKICTMAKEIVQSNDLGDLCQRKNQASSGTEQLIYAKLYSDVLEGKDQEIRSYAKIVAKVCESLRD